MTTSSRAFTARGAIVATILIGSAVTASCGQRTADGDKPTTRPSTSSSPTAAASASTTATSAESTSATQVLDVSDLSSGEPPQLAYAELDYDAGDPVGGTIHAPDGSTVSLPPTSLVEFAAAGDQWVVDGYDTESGSESVYVLDADGDYGDPVQITGGLGVSPEGGVVAWTGSDGTVYALHAATGEILTMPKIPAPGPYLTVGITSEDCKEGRSTAGGCTIFVNTNGRHPRAYYTTSHGIVDRVPGLIRANASDGRHLVGIHSIDEVEPGSCSRMLQDLTEVVWSTCTNTPVNISPDSRHVLGLPAYLDGFGPKSLDILDMADGKPIRSWTSTASSATFFDQVWEDDSHVLMATFQHGKWAVVRVGVDGSLEYAVEPVAGVDLERPVILQKR